MNRTERLYAVVEELRAVAPGVRTARWLAERFEVSTRTVERDIAALLQAGVPVYTDRGRRGGYAVDRAHTLPPLGATPGEATALAAAVRLLDGSPLQAAARSLLQKLVAVMPPADVGAAEGLARRFQLAGPEPAGTVAAAAREALDSGRVLRLRYRDGHGRTTTRSVEPIGFLGSPDGWYPHATCRLRGAERFFRLDRISAAAATGDPCRPAAADPPLLRIPGRHVSRVSLAADQAGGVKTANRLPSGSVR